MNSPLERPKTIAGVFGILVALPPATVKRPPGPPVDSSGPEPAKTVEPVKAKAVGVGTPVATTSTVLPLAAVGSGGPAAPLEATRASDVTAARAASKAAPNQRLDMKLLRC